MGQGSNPCPNINSNTKNILIFLYAGVRLPQHFFNGEKGRRSSETCFALKALNFMLELDPKLCGECGGCVAVCPYGALELFVSSLLIRKDLCTLCQNCIIFCPVGALKITDSKKQMTDKNHRFEMPNQK